jgi:hypothetical protein
VYTAGVIQQRSLKDSFPRGIAARWGAWGGEAGEKEKEEDEEGFFKANAMNEVDAGREEGASAINKVKFEYKRGGGRFVQSQRRNRKYKRGKLCRTR